jgi:glycosyltransferase involved in cell wall biosynthesis
MSSVRVLAVGNMYPPHHQGGYELVWQAAMREARAEGHTVRVLTSVHREPGERPEEEPDVHRELRWYWDWDAYEFPEFSVPERARIELHNARLLRRHLDEFRPDVVAWWSMSCMSLSMIERVRRLGIPAVLVVHDDWLVYGWKFDQWIRMWRGRRLLVAPVAERVLRIPTNVDVCSAGRMLFNSRYTLERAAEAGIRQPDAEVVYPGIDERFLEPVEPRPWRWRLLYIGRIDRQKGVDTAVAALEHLPPEATLTVVGTGDAGYVDEMREQATRLGAGDRVTFAPFAEGHDAVRAAYEDADAVLFPVRWQEPFGLVPLEAMGLGRPVVSTSRGGTAEFVRDGENALLFPVDDAAALAERVERLAGDPALRERLVEEGRRTAARYTLGDFARRIVEETVRAARP